MHQWCFSTFTAEWSQQSRPQLCVLRIWRSWLYGSKNSVPDNSLCHSGQQILSYSNSGLQYQVSHPMTDIQLCHQCRLSASTVPEVFHLSGNGTDCRELMTLSESADFISFKISWGVFPWSTLLRLQQNQWNHHSHQSIVCSVAYTSPRSTMDSIVCWLSGALDTPEESRSLCLHVLE